MNGGVDLAEKRARLVAAAELERMKLALAWHDARAALSPPADPSRRARVRPWVVRAVALALPVLGYRRIGRALRTASTALSIWRVVSAWRSFAQR